MAKKKKHEEHENHERWLVSYADFITLLFAFFVVMFATSQVDSQKVGRFVESVNQALDIKGPFPASGAEPIVMEGSNVSSPPVAASLIAQLAPSKGQPSPGRVEKASLQPLRSALLQYLARPEIRSRVRPVRDRRGLTLSMAGTSLFAPGSDALIPEAAGILDRFGELLRNFNVQVMVEGHTDSESVGNPRFATNWDLSSARAIRVIRYMIEAGHVAPYRFVAVGYGSYRPLAPNDSPEGRALNRRVDFVLLGVDPLIIRDSMGSGMPEGSAEEEGTLEILPEAAPSHTEAPAGPVSDSEPPAAASIHSSSGH